MWSTIIGGIVKLLVAISEYIRDKQLIDAGKAEQIVEQVQVAQKARDDLHQIVNDITTADGLKRQQLRDKWTSDSNS